MTTTVPEQGCTQCDCDGFTRVGPRKCECGHREAEHAPCARKQYQFSREQVDGSNRCLSCGLDVVAHVAAEDAPCARKQYQFPIDQFNHRCGECGLYPSAHVEAEAAPCSLTRDELIQAPPHLVPNGRCSGCGLDVGSHASDPTASVSKRFRFSDEVLERTIRDHEARLNDIVSRTSLLVFYAKHVQRRGGSAISKFGEVPPYCLLCREQAAHGCHVAEVKYFDPSIADENIGHLELLYSWNVDVSHWRRPMVLHAPMNLVPLCEGHHGDFDAHRYLLIYDFLHSRFKFLELASGRTIELRAEHQAGGRFELSHRAVAFRLYRIRAAGSVVLPEAVAAQIDELRDMSIAPSVVAHDDVNVADDAS